MSYVDMDHAGWVESNGAASKKVKGKPKTDGFGRVVGWHAMPEKLNRFQARVMDICGIVFGGIYNAPIAWDTVEWHGTSVHLTLRHGNLATVDFGNLTNLVFLCHEARIRADLQAHGRFLRLGFHHRDDSRGLSTGHPNLEEAVARFHGYLGEGHRIVFDKAQDDREPERAAAHAARAARATAEGGA
jgi:hypothetical protein